MEFFDAHGVRIAANVSGDPSRRKLILLHSGGQTKSTWDQVAPAFAATHHVHALDLRGYGDSEKVGDYGFPAMRDDIFAVLDALGAQEVDLIGHSLGGSIAWLVAQAQPQRVRRLVIEDSPPPKVGVARMTLPERPAEEPPYDWAAMAAIVDQLNNPDPRWWDDMVKVTADVLLLTGGPTSPVPQHLFAQAQAFLTSARIVEIPVGHHIHREALPRFLREATAFLRD
jgi:3-oxoadipate enol-lactonase